MGGKVSSKMAAPVGRVIQVRLAKWPLNCTTASFATQVVRPHAPLIKFPNREGVPRPNAQEALKLAVELPQQSTPSFRPAAAPPSGPVIVLPGTPDTLASIQLLPQRYRRRPLAVEEMDYIQRGGPE